ncbi:MMPL family transporter [Amphritea sp. 2_MG-2023]|uniref:efflux RND transporter permease subunit n=1 Tax=Amphritea TaxID=515417 RepID=UPI001C064D10|nr:MULTISPECIES: MMPL family transporter [Amphritea]MBU2966374.1 MMPL family transporter [Amphritea atlantica]MDO6419812.1 MMPL family transporter [Amphritea sp. 2_MG-2023]
MRTTLVNLSMNRPKWVFLGVLLLTLIAGLQIPSIQVDTDPENMLPADNPARVFHDHVKERFGLHDMIVVGVVNNAAQGIYNPQSLSELHQLSDAIVQMKGVISQDLMSLDRVDNITQEGPGSIRFEWMMKQVPQDQAGIDQIRASVERLPLLNNTLVSGDGKAAGIYVPIAQKSESYRISGLIQTEIDKLSGNNAYYISGLPVAEDTFGVEMFLQMAISAPLAGLMIFILMWVFFRSFLLITAPMLVAMASVIITMGLLIGQGYTVHIMSSMIPIFLMPIAVVDSVHILSEFADRHRPGEDPKTAVKEVLGHLFTPMLYTSVTSAVGFASLAFTPIPPVQVFGLHVAFGIMLAFLLTITLVPAYIISLSPARMAQMKDHNIDEDDNSLLGRLLIFIGRFSIARAKGLLVFFILIVVGSVYGVAQIQINDNPVRWFKQDHPLRVADRVMNHHFPGTYNAFLVLDKTSDLRTGLEQQLSRRAAQEGVDLQQRLDSVNSDSFIEYTNGLINQFDQLSYDDSAHETMWLELLDLTEKAQIDSKYFLTPPALQYVDQLQAFLEQSDYIGKSNSFPTQLKTIYRELNGGTEDQYKLPPSAAAAAQTVLSFQGSHRPNDLWHMVTPDYRSTVLWLQLSSGDNQDMSRVLSLVDGYVADHPLPEGVELNWAGLTYINVVWQDEMVNGMLNSLIGAFFMVLFIMVLLFRSVKIGLLSMLPLTVTILFIYGLIGLIGKDYDMPIAVLSALTLGLSVDFAIHFLERTRAIYRQCGNWEQTVAEVYRGPSRAISRNAVVVAIGFTPLLFAPLVPYITVGFFLAAIMAVSAVVTVMLLPAVMQMIKNKDSLFGVKSSAKERES